MTTPIRSFLMLFLLLPMACGAAFEAGHDAGPGADDAGATGDSAPGDDAMADAGNDGPIGDPHDAQPPRDAQPRDAQAHDSGPRDSQLDSPVCLTDLSGVGTGDFHVAFDLVTSAVVSSALVNQRSGCSPYAGWSVYMSPTGAIEIETDDGTGADRVFQLGGTGANDGNSHHVAAWRTAGNLYVQVDSTPASSPVADTNSLGTLPSLSIGSDACTTDAVPLVGAITNLCITRS